MGSRWGTWLPWLGFPTVPVSTGVRSANGLAIVLEPSRVADSQRFMRAGGAWTSVARRLIHGTIPPRHAGGAVGAPGEHEAQSLRRVLVFDYPRLVGALALMTGDRDLARDSVRRGRRPPWEQVGHGRHIDNLPGWTRTVVLNVVRGRFRRRTTERNAAASLRSSRRRRWPGQPDRRSTCTASRRCPSASAKSPCCSTSSTFPSGRSRRELEITEGTVKTSLHRARIVLVAVLGEEFAVVGLDAGGDTEVHVEV